MKNWYLRVIGLLRYLVEIGLTVKVSENLGATAVAPVAPADTSLQHHIHKKIYRYLGLQQRMEKIEIAFAFVFK